MSGPKIVRVVTRDELLAICDGLIARVEAGLADWEAVCKRSELASPAEIEAVKTRINRLHDLLRRDRFSDIQKEVPQELAFLEADLASRMEKEVQRVALSRSAERRRSEAASALLDELRSRNLLDATMEKSLMGTIAGEGNPEAFRRGIELLAGASSAKSNVNLELARKLGEGLEREKFVSWVAANSTNDPLCDRLEQKLAQLVLIGGQSVGTSLDDRLVKVINEPDVSRRRLLADSLELDIRNAILEARERTSLQREISQSLAELARLGGHWPVIKLDHSTETGVLRETVRLISGEISERRDLKAAQARRQEVLSVLSGLGYEVNEGISVAWIEHGRVVLKKAATPSYGVEISGDPRDPRWQMRAVAFTDGVSGPAVDRDLDAETVWCSDVHALQNQLAAGGGGLTIERALPIGATPLKRIIEASMNDTRSEARKRPRTLTKE